MNHKVLDNLIALLAEQHKVELSDVRESRRARLAASKTG